ncbi:hypothetical protein DBV15_05862, partial [Temnothorax longispinosus]
SGTRLATKYIEHTANSEFPLVEDEIIVVGDALCRGVTGVTDLAGTREHVSVFSSFEVESLRREREISISIYISQPRLIEEETPLGFVIKISRETQTSFSLLVSKYVTVLDIKAYRFLIYNQCYSKLFLR